MASFIERLIKYNEHFLIDDYKLDGATPEQAQLGQGAFGRVYSVYHEVRDNTGVTRYPAAVKIIALDHDSYFRNLPQDSEERVNRNLSKEQRWIDRQLAIVQNEIRIMHGLLGEVNIVYCMRFDYKYFKADGLSCCDVVILMEKLVTLKQYLKDNVPDSDRERLKQVLKIWRHLAAALMICDKRQILHLDIKPDNIFYAPGPDNFTLSDFGISMEGRTFKPGVRRGTFDYMAPEMFDKLGGDNRADMYSLAIVIYELLNDHRLPFQKTDGSYEDRRQAQAERLERKRTVPALSRVPGDVNEVLLKCLEVNPDKRYSDVGALFNVVEYIYYKYARRRQEASALAGDPGRRGRGGGGGGPRVHHAASGAADSGRGADARPGGHPSAHRGGGFRREPLVQRPDAAGAAVHGRRGAGRGGVCQRSAGRLR